MHLYTKHFYFELWICYTACKRTYVRIIFTEHDLLVPSSFSTYQCFPPFSILTSGRDPGLQKGVWWLLYLRIIHDQDFQWRFYDWKQGVAKGGEGMRKVNITHVVHIFLTTPTFANHTHSLDRENSERKLNCFWLQGYVTFICCPLCQKSWQLAVPTGSYN